MGEHFRRQQAKSFQHRECAAYAARLATADLLSGVKDSVETLEATCDLVADTAPPPVGTEVLIQARSPRYADVMACNRRVATLGVASPDLEALLARARGMVLGVVTHHGELTPSITVSLAQTSADE